MKTLISIFALFLCSVCPAIAHPLEGTWEWQHTVTESGELIDADVVGFSRTLVFGHVTHPFEFVEIRDSEVFIVGIWSITDFWNDSVMSEYMDVHTGNVVPYLEGVLEFGPDNNTLTITNFDARFFMRQGTLPNEGSRLGGVKTLYR